MNNDSDVRSLNFTTKNLLDLLKSKSSTRFNWNQVKTLKLAWLDLTRLDPNPTWFFLKNKVKPTPADPPDWASLCYDSVLISDLY
jgi:hypothetical protein